MIAGYVQSDIAIGAINKTHPTKAYLKLRRSKKLPKGHQKNGFTISFSFIKFHLEHSADAEKFGITGLNEESARRHFAFHVHIRQIRRI